MKKNILSHIFISLAILMAFNANATTKNANSYIKTPKQTVEFTFKDVELNKIANSQSLHFNMKQGEMNLNSNFRIIKSHSKSNNHNNHNNSKNKDLPAPIEDIPFIGQFLLCLIIALIVRNRSRNMTDSSLFRV